MKTVLEPVITRYVLTKLKWLYGQTKQSKNVKTKNV